VTRDRHDLRVAHRDPGDVIGRDRALVVGQRVRRRAAERAQRPIKLDAQLGAGDREAQARRVRELRETIRLEEEI
jgi:hypothetical protein